MIRAARAASVQPCPLSCPERHSFPAGSYHGVVQRQAGEVGAALVQEDLEREFDELLGEVRVVLPAVTVLFAATVGCSSRRAVTAG